MPWGCGQCNPFNALPHCQGVVGTATPAMHYRTACGRWTVELPQCACPRAGGTGSLAQYWGQWAVERLQRTASLPGGSGQHYSCNAPPHRLNTVGGGNPAMHCLTAWGQWAVQLVHTQPRSLGVVSSATPAMHCHTAWWWWAVQLLQYSASLPGGSGQCNSCNTLPHSLGAVGSGTPAT